MIPLASARLRSRVSVRASARPARGPRASTLTRENTIAAGVRLRATIHQSGRSSSSSSHHGEANCRAPTPITLPSVLKVGPPELPLARQELRRLVAR